VNDRNPDDQRLLGQALRHLRKSRSLTQKQLASRSGVHVTYISDVERGARNPSWKLLVDLARGLDVPVAAIAEQYDRLAGGPSSRRAT
jgi:transcriptional regulator with XRE-family HTH domain